MKDYWFIDENYNNPEGEEARQALENKSDQDFLSDSQGIVQIPQNRWKIAQTFEKRMWTEKATGTSDDRNLQHMAEFDNYRALEAMTFNHAIELGCGPFTNLRLIGQIAMIKKCSLLDPLIKSYLNHRNCSYNEKMLWCGESKLAKLLSKPRIFRLIRRFIRRLDPALLSSRCIPVDSLIVSPIEEMPIHNIYDLIVIENVIEHCYDANLVMANILKIAAPNAILVFHDKYFNHEIVSHLVNGHFYDAGHPLMVDRKVFDEFMKNNFDTLYMKTAIKKIEYNPVMPQYEGFFFIGRIHN